MRIRTSLPGVAIRVFATVMLVAAFIAGGNSVTAQTCPLDSVKNAAGECVFNTDKTLGTEPGVPGTLILESNTTLNCQGHSLRAARPGSGTATAARSFPEVAIFLNGVHNVVIKNCTFNRFDFAIFAINSKRSPASAPPIQILNNRITARFVGISLMFVDDAEIRGNQVTFTTAGGRGLYVGRNSDRNKIVNNEIRVNISSAPLDANSAVRAPGPVGSSNPVIGPSNPNARESSAVLIAQTEGPEPALLNAIIEGVRYQLPVGNSVELKDFSDGNVFERNAIVTVGTVRVDGINVSGAQNTLVSRNRIVGGRVAIREGVQTTTKLFPGTCTIIDLEPEPHPRFCLGNGDCTSLPGANVGNCQTLVPQLLFWVSHNTIIEDNEITTAQGVPFDIGISANGINTVITGNEITGPGTSSDAIGIRMVGRFALGTTTVTRNSVKDVAFALDLIHDVPSQPLLNTTVYSATVSMNDFINFRKAVKLNSPPSVAPYTLFTELSGGTETSTVPRGNFWNRSLCPDEGFLADLVEPPNPRVTDSHPFGQAVLHRASFAPCR